MGRLTLGLIIGLVIGFFVGHFLPDKRIDPWVVAGLQWETLPAHQLAGPLPQTFAVPPRAYDYGAATLPLSGMIKAQQSILRIEAEAKIGKIGVLLTSPDGVDVLSKEKILTPKEGLARVYFSVTPQTPPAIVVLRNFDADRTAGSVIVRSAAYAAPSDLTKNELSAVNAAGVQ